MSAYITAAAIYGKIPQQKVDDALDDSGAGNPQGIAALLVQIIANASAAVEDVLGSRYNTPFGQVVTDLVLTAGGTDYEWPLRVAFTGGGGYGAMAVAEQCDGIIAKLTLTAGGKLYTSAPAVAITGNKGTGATATAVCAVPPTVVQATLLFAIEDIFGRRQAATKDMPFGDQILEMRERLAKIAARKMPLDANLPELLNASAHSQPFLRPRLNVREEEYSTR